LPRPRLKATAEIIGDAPDKKARITAGALEDPGDQSRRGGLAVGAGDYYRAVTADAKFAQGVGKRHVGDAAVEDLLDLDIAAGNDIADHNQIRRRIQMSRIKSGKNLNLLLREEIAHRRIDAAVRTADLVPLVFQQRGQGGHGCAANGEKIDPLGLWCCHRCSGVRDSSASTGPGPGRRRAAQCRPCSQQS